MPRRYLTYRDFAKFFNSHIGVERPKTFFIRSLASKNRNVATQGIPLVTNVTIEELLLDTAVLDLHFALYFQNLTANENATLDKINQFQKMYWPKFLNHSFPGVNFNNHCSNNCYKNTRSLPRTPALGEKKAINSTSPYLRLLQMSVHSILESNSIQRRFFSNSRTT